MRLKVKKIMHRLRFCALLPLLFLALLGPVLSARGAEVMPPAPAAYCNDYAHILSPIIVDQLNTKLERFERDTSNQIVVAIFPKMESDSSMSDYTFRIKESWKVGQRGKDNGAVLFVFMADHKLDIETGYGLESVLPDALCHRIVTDIIVPRLRQGDYDGGISAGVNAMLAATHWEYHGDGTTVQQRKTDSSQAISSGVFLLFFLLFVILRIIAGPSRYYGPSGYSSFGWGGGGFGGGSFGGGGGGFSGGGGTGGGGGAGGSW